METEPQARGVAGAPGKYQTIPFPVLMFINGIVIWFYTIETEWCYDANFVATGGTASCRNDNQQWRLWRQSWHHNNP